MDNDLVLDLREDDPDNDLCVRCQLPRFAHPLNLTDRDALDHYFTVAGELVPSDERIHHAAH